MCILWGTYYHWYIQYLIITTQHWLLISCSVKELEIFSAEWTLYRTAGTSPSRPHPTARSLHSPTRCRASTSLPSSCSTPGSVQHWLAIVCHWLFLAVCGVFGAGRRQEYMSPPTAVAPYVRERGGKGYGILYICCMCTRMNACMCVYFWSVCHFIPTCVCSGPCQPVQVLTNGSDWGVSPCGLSWQPHLVPCSFLSFHGAVWQVWCGIGVTWPLCLVGHVNLCKYWLYNGNAWGVSSFCSHAGNYTLYPVAVYPPHGTVWQVCDVEYIYIGVTWPVIPTHRAVTQLSPCYTWCGPVCVPSSSGGVGHGRVLCAAPQSYHMLPNS